MLNFARFVHKPTSFLQKNRIELKTDVWKEKVRMDAITLPRNIFKWDSNGLMTTLILK